MKKAGFLYISIAPRPGSGFYLRAGACFSLRDVPHPVPPRVGEGELNKLTPLPQLGEGAVVAIR